MKVLFWNTHQNEKINYILSEIILENNISIAVLAEYSAKIEELLPFLAQQGKIMFPYMNVGCERITLVGSMENVSPGQQTTYSTIQIVNNKFILCGVHLPSRIYNNSDGMRNIAITELIENIQKAEKELGTENTIIVGDFNVNPYESAFTEATLFHSLPIYSETQRKSRKIVGKEFRMFYNPMWNFFGDFSEPYGTYYYSGNDTNNTYWNIYDQVIIRPELRERFVNDSLKIVTRTSSQSLLNKKGHPDKKISDHLPIIFEIQED